MQAKTTDKSILRPMNQRAQPMSVKTMMVKIFLGARLALVIT